MKTKDKQPLAHLEGKQPPRIVALYYELNHLKQLFRQGWLQRGIPETRCESVADHTCGVALLAMFIADRYFPGLSMEKVLRLTLLHDFGEIHAGDITPSDRVAKQEKAARERDSFGRVLAGWPEQERYIDLWTEYEDNRSPEARFVRQVEKLEMALQASVYEHQGLAELGEFFESTEPVLKDPVLREILASLKALRDENGF